MTDESKNTETKERKKRQPKVVLGIIKDAKGGFDEIEFESKNVVKEFVTSDCKGKFTRDGWIALKSGGHIKFIENPQYLAYATKTIFTEVSIATL